MPVIWYDSSNSGWDQSSSRRSSRLTTCSTSVHYTRHPPEEEPYPQLDTLLTSWCSWIWRARRTPSTGSGEVWQCSVNLMIDHNHSIMYYPVNIWYLGKGIICTRLWCWHNSWRRRVWRSGGCQCWMLGTLSWSSRAQLAWLCWLLEHPFSSLQGFFFGLSLGQECLCHSLFAQQRISLPWQRHQENKYHGLSFCV